MNLNRKTIFIPAFLSLLFLLIFPSLLPHLRLYYFAPFLVMLYYNKSYLFCLWSSLLCGLSLDLLSSHTHLGLHAFDYCLTSAILYGQQRHFFADRLSTLPIMTFFFSFISTLIQMMLMYTFETPISISWKWVFIDLLGMSLCDGLFAFFCFILPAFLLENAKRRKNHKISS